MRSSTPFFLFRPRLRFVVAALGIAVLATGCASRRPAPVEERTTTGVPPPAVAPSPVATPLSTEPRPVPTYTVRRGDTLHQIALDNGLDYRELAAWNNIENANVIRVGQMLRLAAPGETPQIVQDGAPGVVTAPLRAPPAIVESRPGAVTAPGTVSSAAPMFPSGASPAASPPGPAAAMNLKTSPKAIKEPYSDQAVRELTLAASAVPAPSDTLAMAAPSSVRAEPKPESRAAAATPPPAASQPPAATAGDADQLDWAWPVKGRVIAGFSDTANLKGIDIAGTAGQAVHASAPGRIVYAGSGLRGYGKLIIIKHNATYLSAYAHNREILVKEGQQVTRGQKIAEMGSTDADQVKLHFEIRRLGKPMDPSKYLPPA